MKKCNDCKNCIKLCMNTPRWCKIIKQQQQKNKYTGQIIHLRETYPLDELNHNGDCKYYEPLLIVKIKNKLKGIRG